MSSTATELTSVPSALHPAELSTVAFDEDGFLLDGTAWNRDLAQALAREAGVEHLGADHWQLIGVVRERYHQLGSLPVMRRVCRAAGIEPGTAQRLFSGCRSLWRIAGLPNPGAEAIAYMH